ncbi:MAG: polymerase sigma factor, sigma-70 family [Parcubacteria group bacterium]|nr:polymerase sigma factor, sigma-70 family [Parcubacteria group bacterium]
MPISIDEYTKTKDDDLMFEFVQGDERAFNELYERYYPKLRRTVFNIVYDADATKDVLQETFFQLIRSRGAFVHGSFRGWIYSIAKSYALKELRRRKADRASNFSALRKEGSEKPMELQIEDTRAIRPDMACHEKLLSEAALAAVRSIEAPFSETLLLRMKDSSYDEIGEAMNCPVGTVRSRLSGARMRVAPLRRKIAS